MDALNTDLIGEVKSNRSSMSVQVHPVDWPGRRLAVIKYDGGGFHVFLNRRHEHVRAWLEAPTKRAHARALARLLMLLGHNLRAASGINPFEYAASKKAIEIYGGGEADHGSL